MEKPAPAGVTRVAEPIHVAKCPVCGKAHDFTIEEYMTYLYSQPAMQAPSNDKAEFRDSLYFCCPEKSNTMFKVRVVFSPGSRPANGVVVDALVQR